MKNTEEQRNKEDLIEDITKIDKKHIQQTGKGRFTNNITSLKDIETALRGAGIIFYFIGPKNITNKYENGKYIVTAEGTYRIKNKKNNWSEFKIECLGADPNDPSFALGKALTYAKRYFLGGFTSWYNMPDAEMISTETEAQNLKKAVSEKFERSKKATIDEIKTEYTKTFNKPFDINGMTLSELEQINKML